MSGLGRSASTQGAWPLGLWCAARPKHAAVINDYNEQTIIGALLPDAPPEDAEQTVGAIKIHGR